MNLSNIPQDIWKKFDNKEIAFKFNGIEDFQASLKTFEEKGYTCTEHAVEYIKQQLIFTAALLRQNEKHIMLNTLKVNDLPIYEPAKKDELKPQSKPPEPKPQEQQPQEHKQELKGPTINAITADSKEKEQSNQTYTEKDETKNKTNKQKMSGKKAKWEHE